MVFRCTCDTSERCMYEVLAEKEKSPFVPQSTQRSVQTTGAGGTGGSPPPPSGMAPSTAGMADDGTAGGGTGGEGTTGGDTGDAPPDGATSPAAATIPTVSDAAGTPASIAGGASGGAGGVAAKLTLPAAAIERAEAAPTAAFVRGTCETISTNCGHGADIVDSKSDATNSRKALGRIKPSASSSDESTWHSSKRPSKRPHVSTKRISTGLNKMLAVLCPCSDDAIAAPPRPAAAAAAVAAAEDTAPPPAAKYIRMCADAKGTR
mmetsp:Transcript_112557/g.363480  ORF Transcript_112557/g.363480 Transcript_112557/m.363480 type:complete len:264 (+) Transcript_112557:33-824(+)